MKIIPVLMYGLLVVAATATATASTPTFASTSTSASGSGSGSAVGASASSSSSSALAGGAAWTWPLIAPHTVVSGFEAPPTAYAAGHRGIDIASTVDEAVYAPQSGVVSFAGRVVDRGVLSLAIDGDLLVSVEPVVPLVIRGEHVVAGQVIATVDTGGHCGSRCLHLGVRLHGRYISPLHFLGGVPLAVLLPVPDPGPAD